jgi:hypothetical protein
MSPLDRDSVFIAYDESFGDKILDVMQKYRPSAQRDDLRQEKDDIVTVFVDWVTAPKEKTHTVTVNPDTTTIVTTLSNPPIETATITEYNK